MNVDFGQLTQWSAIATVAFAAIAALGFALGWGIRFRLVGTTGFMLVLTGGLFALSIAGPIIPTTVPGSVRYQLVYDGGADRAVIKVPDDITAPQLEATLRQAAANLFSPGRRSGGDDRLTIRARTLLHPEPGITRPLWLGQVRRSLRQREDENMTIEVYGDRLAQLPDRPATER